jgi:hypothetical protein
MKFNNIVFFIIFFALNSSAQKYTVSGFISDASNGETIVGANIFCKELGLGTSANTYGFYSLTLPKGSYQITYSFLGYDAEVVEINFDKDVKKNVQFKASSTLINEVIVSSEKNVVQKTQTSTINIPIKQIKKIPALLGRSIFLRLFSYFLVFSLVKDLQDFMLEEEAQTKI